MSTYLSPDIYVREIDFSFYVKQISTSSAGMVGIAERGPINKPALVTSWEQFVNRFGSYIPESYLAYAARSFFDNGGQVLYVNRIAHYLDPTDRASLTALPSAVVLVDRRPPVLGHGGAPHPITWVLQNPSGPPVTVTFVTTGTNSPLTVEVSGNAITVHLATNASGASTSTTADVVAALSADPDSTALVDLSTRENSLVGAMGPFDLTLSPTPQNALRVRAIEEGTWGDQITVEVTDGTLRPATEFNLVVRHKGQVVELFRDLSMDEALSNHVELVVNERSQYIAVRDLSPGSVGPEDRPAVGSFALTGGDNGIAEMWDSDFVGDPAIHTGLYAFDEIDALNLLMVPGVSSAPVIHGGIAYCENRKDVMFLGDSPILLEPLEMVEFRKGIGIYDHAAFNSSYAALYYPWLEISDPATGKKKLIPPSGAAAGCCARTDEKTYVWYAPAGIDRGRVFNAIGLGYKTSKGERDVLYPEGVNVIASFPDTGINIWGQKTLQSQPSATDRINVRRLMMYIEEAIAESSRFVVFEPNNPITWRALIRLINPFLQDIKDNGGFYDFAVQCDAETNTPAIIDRNELLCRIFVKPTKTAEFIRLDFVLTTTGADFTEIFKLS
jgi:phage tail sheath protein FI